LYSSLHYATAEPQRSDAQNILNFSEFEPYDSYKKWVPIVPKSGGWTYWGAAQPPYSCPKHKFS